jgi:YD repeat-containing protein
LDNTFILVKKHGTEFSFDNHGNLASITDRNNNKITFTYDSNGLMPVYGTSEFFLSEKEGGPANSRGIIGMAYKLVTITDDVNRQTNLTYNEEGLLSAITDYAGRVWRYKYDTLTNDLLSVTGPATEEYPDGLSTTYTYDNHHRLLTTTDPNGQTFFENTYDSQGRVATQKYGDGTYTFAYDPDSNETTVTDRKEHENQTVFDNRGNIVSDTITTEGLRDDDPDYYTTSYKYDSLGQITKILLPSGNYIKGISKN